VEIAIIKKVSMKNTTLILSVLIMTLSSFTPNSTSGSKASEQTALRIVAALQHSSAMEYAALYPTLAEFHQIMTENEAFYGMFAKEARDEFALDYERYLIPKAKESFHALIKEGRNKGIDWSKVRFVRVAVVEEEDADTFTSAPFTVVVSAEGKEYKIRIEKALFINGSWRVSQFIKLV
jgi:hypothetical protein